MLVTLRWCVDLPTALVYVRSQLNAVFCHCFVVLFCSEKILNVSLQDIDVVSDNSMLPSGLTVTIGPSKKVSFIHGGILVL